MKRLTGAERALRIDGLVGGEVRGVRPAIRRERNPEIIAMANSAEMSARRRIVVLAALRRRMNTLYHDPRLVSWR